METREPAGLLALASPLRPAPPGVPPALPRAPPREPCGASPLRGALEPAFLRLRNERERQRVRCVNEGYARLRDHLPAELAARRLSKVQTLRAAVGYIQHLQELLQGPAAPPRRPDGHGDGEPRPPCGPPEEGAR